MKFILLLAFFFMQNTFATEKHEFQLNDSDSTMFYDAFARLGYLQSELDPQDPNLQHSHAVFKTTNEALVVICTRSFNYGLAQANKCTITFDFELSDPAETEIVRGIIGNVIGAKIFNTTDSFDLYSNVLGYQPFLQTAQEVVVTLPNGNKASYPMARLACKKEVEEQYICQMNVFPTTDLE